MIPFWLQIPDPWRHHPGFPWQYYSFWISFLPNFRQGNLENPLSWWRSTDWVPLYLEWFSLPSSRKEFLGGRLSAWIGNCPCVYVLKKHLKKFPNLFGACRVFQISPARKGEGYTIWCILLVSERDLMLTSHQPFFTGENLI
jgi:hypothetical protein